MVDMVTGLYAAIGILMALLERESSGKGQYIDMTLYDSAVALMHPYVINYVLSGKVPQSTGNAHPNLSPYDKFSTKTVDIFVGCGNNRAFQKFAEALGHPELATNPLFANNADRINNKEAFREAMEVIFAERDGEEVCDVLMAAVAWMRSWTGTVIPASPSSFRGPRVRSGRRPRNSASTDAKSWRSSVTVKRKLPLWRKTAFWWKSAAETASPIKFGIGAVTHRSRIVALLCGCRIARGVSSKTRSDLAGRFAQQEGGNVFALAEGLIVVWHRIAARCGLALPHTRCRLAVTGGAR